MAAETIVVTALKARIPSYIVALVYATFRSPIRSTPGTTVAARARCSASNSSATVNGPPSTGSYRTASPTASFAAARMSAAVRAGVRHTAAYRETWSLTATFSASGA